MSTPETNIFALDARYKPFPTFKEWSSTTSIDELRWDRYSSALKKDSALSPERLRRAQEIATRAAAIDTGAIEGLYDVDRGFTYTVAFETAAWELTEKGERIRPLFESQLRAYDYVLTLATKGEPISEAAIRTLHQVVCEAQETYRVATAIGPQEQVLPKGKYTVLPNHVRTREGTDHSYAPVDMTPAEMARLVGELRTEEFFGAHPVIQAAYAHYALVVIHPFADGNGRVARALASAFTYRAVSMPIVILSEHKSAYLDALEAADAGNFQAFVDFLLARSLDTMQLIEESLRGAGVPSADESIADINTLYQTKSGYSQDEVDEAGLTLLSTVVDALTKIIPSDRTKKVFGQIGPVQGAPTPTRATHTHREPSVGARGFRIALESAPPAAAVVDRWYYLWLPKDAGSDDDILIAAQNNADSFSARTDELIPRISASLQLRVNVFAQRLTGEMLKELKSKAAAALGRG